MGKQHIHKIFALLFALIILFPTTIQAIHALDNHEHKVCSAKDVKHIHQQNDDCSIYHATLDNNVPLLDTANSSFTEKIYFECFNSTPQINSLGLFKLKSPRAPPLLS